MIRPRLFATLILIFGMTLAQAKGPVKRASKQPRGSCKSMVESLQRLYKAGDPAYLTWDFTTARCDSAQLYTAFYHQGIGFLFISAYKQALYFLASARAIGGDKDEEIIFHQWTIYRKLNRYAEMERLTLELNRRYPGSLFLMEILDQWKAVRSPAAISWGYTAKASWARSPYLDHVLSQRVRGEVRQKLGAHQFRETGTVTVKTDWDEKLLQSFQSNLGGDWEYKEFSAEAHWGIGYESRRSDSATGIITAGSQSILVDSNWNFAQGRIALGYALSLGTEWNLGWNLSAAQLSPEWRVLGFTHSQSYLFSSLILVGYIDLQNHWINISKDTVGIANPSGVPFSVRELKGMESLRINLTPYFTFSRHSLGLGPTYYLSRLTYKSTGATGNAGSANGNADSEMLHSLTATGSYGYDFRHWCRFIGNVSYGFDFDNASGTTDYKVTDVYGVEAGVALSF